MSVPSQNAGAPVEQPNSPNAAPQTQPVPDVEPATKSEPGTVRSRAHIVSRLAADLPGGEPAFTASLLRGRNVSGREILARAASGGALGDRELIELGTGLADGSTSATAFVRSADPDRLAAYAFVLACQLGRPQDQRAALGLFDALTRSGFVLARREAETHAQLLVAARRLDDALDAAGRRGVRASNRALTEADCMNPHVRPGAPTQEWIHALSAALVTSGTIPIALSPDGPTAFDRLTSGEPERAGSIDGPLVAVIMSAFNPDHRLITAVNSMIQQTWNNWELLIVDDASPQATAGVLAQAEGMDPRVRVIRKAVNGGTYRARNTALRQTGADFFTTLDSDDWAHPQRLEKGMGPLLADGAVMATRSMGVRADEDLIVTRPGYHGHLVNAPSLLVRMHPAVSRIGFFDTVRKAADTEYALRLEAAFGVPVETLRADVLTMARHEASSLSFGEFAPGWRHEARSAYRAAYGRWHAEIRAGADPFLDPEAPRIFPAPARWQPPLSARLVETTTVDVVLMDDMRVDRPGAAATVQRIAGLQQAGLTVALLHTENLLAAELTESPLDPAVQALVDRAVVDRIYPEDRLRARAVLVGHPELLQFPFWAESTFPADRVLVIAAGSEWVDRDSVSASAAQLFGGSVEFVLDGTTAAAIAGLLTARTARGHATPEVEPEYAAQPADLSVVTTERGWLNLATRRPGDGEHADALAIRYVAGPAGEAGALDLARALAARLQPGERVTEDVLRDLAPTGVDLVAQRLSGQVYQLSIG